MLYEEKIILRKKSFSRTIVNVIKMCFIIVFPLNIVFQVLNIKGHQLWRFHKVRVKGRVLQQKHQIILCEEILI